MKIIIGADHAGFELKQALIPFLKKLGHVVDDKGAHELTPDDDYPEFIVPVAQEISMDLLGKSKGIIIGGSGQGEAIAANRFPGVRAIVYYGGNEEIIKLSREHNDANILSFGARFISIEDAKKAVELWLATPFSQDERHMRRIEEMDSIE